jgi:hypothetical protein
VKGGVIIRFLSAFPIALLFVLTAGCDGDGGGDAATSEETPTEPGDTGPETIVLGSGAATAEAGTRTSVSDFSVTETGTLDARLVWSDGPATLTLGLFLIGEGPIAETVGSSPLSVSTEVIQYLLSLGTSWVLYVDNMGPDPVEVEYRVRFTPN